MVCSLGKTDELGKAPVQYDDLAEICQHNVMAFEVAVDHTARMSVGDVLQTVTKPPEQAEEFQRILLSANRFRWYARLASLRVCPLTNRMV